jgi:hypothetical protein
MNVIFNSPNGTYQFLTGSGCVGSSLKISVGLLLSIDSTKFKITLKWGTCIHYFSVRFNCLHSIHKLCLNTSNNAYSFDILGYDLNKQNKLHGP